ncbi:PKD domain-containing protein [Methanosarcina barkeri]|uniref:Cell surface protein n=1 Tax=Methanosarcina barkeri 227 TaxID=1434106 RepID=A0A0E3QZQ7_METBA|nr:PKD domain-containing protein [Methanosarcina barkeri]AKB56518.1 cell surface protein [Methanosarcina barkeri 227]
MKKLIIILALVGALSLVSIASAQFSSLQTWGSFGNDAGQFYGMSGIATDTSGNVYVAELDNRVQKFSGNGGYLTEFNIPARDIAIDSAGNIYATVNDSIQKFDSAGTLLNTWGSTGTENRYFNFPTGIALDSLGNIYVSDMKNNRIQKLDSSGNYLTSWGTLGSGNGNLKSPAGITVSGNYVYVADMGNYRVQKFGLDGTYVSSLGSKGTDNTQFNGSIAVANNPSGNIYVADYYNDRVIEYDSNFGYLAQYTGLSYPTALVLANDNLYVLGSGDYQVYQYNDDIHANFTANVTSGFAPLTVQFTNLSENADTIAWDFENDGSIDSGESNPVHEFTTPGNYTVNLTASNANGTDSALATINVFENVVFPGYTNSPTDLDHNGLCEDINGNGIVEFDDVVAYYANMDWMKENVPVTLFDYNNNNIIDFDDVVKLYNLL